MVTINRSQYLSNMTLCLSIRILCIIYEFFSFPEFLKLIGPKCIRAKKAHKVQTGLGGTFIIGAALGLGSEACGPTRHNQFINMPQRVVLKSLEKGKPLPRSARALLAPLME